MTRINPEFSVKDFNVKSFVEISNDLIEKLEVCVEFLRNNFEQNKNVSHCPRDYLLHSLEFALQNQSIALTPGRFQLS
ncbi:hypothetical protein [Candidatus Spongiihabitans sp.]|uniref:hypothetical protein n=1 Tax=Candidatus Spongiihabitans sp. TaxID=3101308 RepID=UPI003C6EEBEC